ncbi:hypothetical protein ABT369_39520 [Dactylosporangium sp. NPDC000244]|uniref:hypothetical protein n=1 Tax=Dactylosporangium sp. NPDC000244 TaxID=3154365 RepID=UPI00331F72AE
MTLPQLRHAFGRDYRIWTVGLLPLHRLPKFEPGIGAPAFTPVGGWTVNVVHGRIEARCGGMCHELDGVAYPDDQAAWRATYGAGLVGVLVDERNSAGYDFPTGGAA